MTLAPGLNSKLAEMLPGRQAGRRFAEFAYNNNTEDNSLISSHCETSHSKGFSVSARTLEDDMDKLAKDGLVDKHRATVVLDGQTYPSVVYGSLDAFKADIEQARAVLAAEIATMAQGERTDVEPSLKLAEVSHAEAAEIANFDHGGDRRSDQKPKLVFEVTNEQAAEKLDVSDKYVREAKKIQRESPEHFDKVKSGELSLQQADPEVEPLPFSRDVADKLEHYCISRDQWRKETLGGELAAVRFSELIDQVDGEARQAVLKIPAPEIFSANLALKQVLSNRPSGLEMLGRWSA
jgi:hypothetical protein